MRSGDDPEHLFHLAEQIQSLVNGDARMLDRGRFLSTSFMLQLGTKQLHYEIVRGRVASVSPEPRIMPTWHFSIRGEPESWAGFWQPYPAPGWHDIFAMAKLGRFRIEGDFQPLMTNLLYFKSLLSAPRRLSGEG